VGFQTANFARHFRQTVSRVLEGCETLPKGIQIGEGFGGFGSGGDADGEGGGRFVDVGVFPMGIDVNSLRKKRCVLLRSPTI
jgi:trehalose-6-phosphate synthase